jgi:hypothetical protein
MNGKKSHAKDAVAKSLGIRTIKKVDLGNWIFKESLKIALMVQNIFPFPRPMVAWVSPMLPNGNMANPIPADKSRMRIKISC